MSLENRQVLASKIQEIQEDLDEDIQKKTLEGDLKEKDPVKEKEGFLDSPYGGLAIVTGLVGLGLGIYSLLKRR